MFSNPVFSNGTLSLADFFTEKVQKKLKKFYNKKSYKFTNKIFNGYDRITYPFNFEIEQKNVLKNHKEYIKVRDYLSALGYEILDYFAGTCKKHIEEDNRVFKIGRVFKQNNAPASLVVVFTNGELRQGSKLSHSKCCVTVSRNLVDIAAMSTKRGWSSCMNLHEDGDEDYNSYVYEDISSGTHIMYLHREADVEIKNPIARILLKPYLKDIKGKKRVILVPEYSSYGLHNEKFKQMATSWARFTHRKKYYDLSFIKDSDLYDDGSSDYYYVVDVNDRQIPYLKHNEDKKVAYIQEIDDKSSLAIFAYDDSSRVRQEALRALTEEKDICKFADDDCDEIITNVLSMIKNREIIEYMLEKHGMTYATTYGLLNNDSVSGDQFVRYANKYGKEVNAIGELYWRIPTKLIKKIHIRNPNVAFNYGYNSIFETTKEWLAYLNKSRSLYKNYIIFGRVFREDEDFIKLNMASENMLMRVQAVFNAKVNHMIVSDDTIPNEFDIDNEDFRDWGRSMERYVRDYINGHSESLELTEVDLGDFFPGVEKGKYVFDIKTLNPIT